MFTLQSRKLSTPQTGPSRSSPPWSGPIRLDQYSSHPSLRSSLSAAIQRPFPLSGTSYVIREANLMMILATRSSLFIFTFPNIPRVLPAQKSQPNSVWEPGSPGIFLIVTLTQQTVSRLANASGFLTRTCVPILRAF
jgi:hypothetical protein